MPDSRDSEGRRRTPAKDQLASRDKNEARCRRAGRKESRGRTAGLWEKKEQSPYLRIDGFVHLVVGILEILTQGFRQSSISPAAIIIQSAGSANASTLSLCQPAFWQSAVKIRPLAGT